jgi:hypothetical protein
VLTGHTPAAVTYNTFATREALEPSDNGYRTLWFKWTAQAAGQTQILTQGSDSFYKLITVYTGTSINTLTKVIQSGTGNFPTTTFNSVAGQTYYISVASYYSSDSGSILFSIFGQPGSPTVTPPLAISRAVKLRFQTETGRTYRFQESTDLGTWNSLTNVVTGNGAIHEIYVDGQNSPNRMFRVVPQ